MELDRIIALSNTVTVYRDGDRCVKVFDASHSAADVLQEALPWRPDCLFRPCLRSRR